MQKVCQAGVHTACRNDPPCRGVGIRISRAEIMARSIAVERHSRNYPNFVLTRVLIVLLIVRYSIPFIEYDVHVYCRDFIFVMSLYFQIEFSHSLWGVRSIMVSVTSTPFIFLMLDSALSSSESDCACISTTMSQRPLDVYIVRASGISRIERRVFSLVRACS